MGDSAVAEVTGEVVMEQASSTQTFTKHSVTSIKTTHVQSSHESSVRVESVVQGGSAEQSLAVESVVQEGSAGQSLAVESSHTEVVTDIPKEEAPPAEEPQPEPEPQPVEPQPVDENANAIQEEQEAQAVQEQVEEHVPEEPSVPAEEQEPVPAATDEAPAEAAPAEEPTAEASADAEISQENIKSQLHEIISEIEEQVLPEHEEEGVLHHTWRPKGKYDLQKTSITYEDVVPIDVPEVKLKEPEPKPAPQPQPQVVQEPQPMPQEMMQEAMHNGDMSPHVMSPLDIPEGIPLLARILPKVDGEGDKKISLERLFTPATDSGDLTPKKSAARKMYSSSAFYRPDHPTIDDQVELAQRISFSLVDDNNKMSRGQSMYLKRKNRSMRWIHQGGEMQEFLTGSGAGGEMLEDEGQRPLEKPPMKLLMNPKGVQDFQAVQEHYENLMNAAPTSPDVGKVMLQSPVLAASPSGKGAELFAKRKKRMDKFIVDETTVQKAQQQTTSTQQTSSFSSSFSSSSKSVSSSSSSSFTSMKQAEMERNRQQEQIMFAAPPMGGAPTAPAAAPASGPFNLPELTKILTQPPKSEFSKSKSESSKPNPVASKASLVARKARSWQPSGSMLTAQQPERVEAHAPLPPNPLARNPFLVSLPAVTSPGPSLTPSQSFSSSCQFPTHTLSCLPAKNPHVDGNASKATVSCHENVNSSHFQPGSLKSLHSSEISEPVKSSVSTDKSFLMPRVLESVMPSVASDKTNVQDENNSALNVKSASIPITTSPLLTVMTPASDPNTFPSKVNSFPPEGTLSDTKDALLPTNAPPSLSVTAAFSLSAAPSANTLGACGAFPASTAALSLSITSPTVNPSYFSVMSISDAQNIAKVVASSVAITASSGNSLHSDTTESCIFTAPLSAPMTVVSANRLHDALPSNSPCYFSLDPVTQKPGVKTDLSSVIPKTEGKENHQHSTKLISQPLAHDIPEDSSLIQPAHEMLPSNPEDLSSKISHDSTQADCSDGNNVRNQGNELIPNSNSNMINCTVESELNASNHTSDNRPLRPTSLPLIPVSPLVNNVVPHSCVTPAHSLFSTSPPNPYSLLPDKNYGAQHTPTYHGSIARCSVDSRSSFCLEQSPHCKDTFNQKLHTPIVSVVKSVPNVTTSEGRKVTPVGQSVKLPSALVLPKGSVCPPASMIVSPDSRRSPSPTVRQKGRSVERNFDELRTPYCLVKCNAQDTRYCCKQETSLGSSQVSDCENFVGTSHLEPQVPFGSESGESEYNVNLMEEDDELETVSVAIPEIHIAPTHRPSIDETELRKYLGELEEIFKQNPDEVSSITVNDLKPPDFYRSVSRTSLNQEVEDGAPIFTGDDSHDNIYDISTITIAAANVDTSQAQSFCYDEQSKEEASPLPNIPERDRDESGEQERQQERQSAPATTVGEGRESEGQREENGTEQICGYVDNERRTMEACKDIAEPCENPWLRSASPPMFPSSKGTNPPTPSTGTGAIYTAEVKVVQRASLPPTPVDVPQHSLLDLVSQESSVNKRRSLNFNLAAKGFGTYNNFYTPVSFAT